MYGRPYTRLHESVHTCVWTQVHAHGRHAYLPTCLCTCPHAHLHRCPAEWVSDEQIVCHPPLIVGEGHKDVSVQVGENKSPHTAKLWLNGPHVRFCFCLTFGGDCRLHCGELHTMPCVHRTHWSFVQLCGLATRAMDRVGAYVAGHVRLPVAWSAPRRRDHHHLG